jgi:hypothetical protein
MQNSMAVNQNTFLVIKYYQKDTEIIAENWLKQALEKLLHVGGLLYSWMKIQLFVKTS